MKAVVGVFKSRFDAVNGAATLPPLGVGKNKIKMLMPHATEGELAAVPVVDSEQPGMGKAVGAVVGGAMGLAAGEAIASLLIPGVGPILAIGIAAAALGALGGGTAGGAVENSMTDGLPGDELFIYEDALRQGRSVVIAMAEDDEQAQAVRGTLEEAGAESIDRAREMWWIGLRDIEKEAYKGEVKDGNFENDERYFRCGFEAAQHAGNRGKSYDACRVELGKRHPDMHEHSAFRRGFTRGRAYREELIKHGGTQAGA
jgi:hypothetical protein